MAPVEGGFVDAEQVGHVLRGEIGQGLDLLPQEGLLGFGAEEGGASVIKKDPVPRLGRGGMIGIVVVVGCDILDHWATFFLIFLGNGDSFPIMAVFSAPVNGQGSPSPAKRW